MRALLALLSLLAILALASCTDYAHRSTFHAPGVVDLSTPVPHENGNKPIEVPADPGSETYAVFVAGYVIGGLARDDAGSEFGAELRFEHHSDQGVGYLDSRAFAVTAGVGFLQWTEQATFAPGAFYGEVNYRFLAGDTVPLDVGVGPALYAGDPNVGGQITIRSIAAMLRTRYMSGTGLEVMFGYEMPFPFLFQRSR